jgi:hypothetical protein
MTACPIELDLRGPPRAAKISSQRHGWITNSNHESSAILRAVDQYLLIDSLSNEQSAHVSGKQDMPGSICCSSFCECAEESGGFQPNNMT